MKQFSFDRIFATVATMSVVFGLVAGFWVIGPPGRQRLINADRKRLQDLWSISQNLYLKATRQEDYQLPENLPENNIARDPLTNQPYSYRQMSEKTYQLCADFSTDSSTYFLKNRTSNSNLDKWQHRMGRYCFKFDVTEQPPNIY